MMPNIVKDTLVQTPVAPVSAPAPFYPHPKLPNRHGLQAHGGTAMAVLQDVTLQKSSTVAVNAGNVQYSGSLAKNASASITVNVGNADVHLSQGTAAALRATTDVGNTTVVGWPATVQRTVTGATAQVNVSANPTSDLTVSVHTGNITVSLR
jgi:hypothetical protein